MAKLKAPLLSLGATQQLGKTIVFFNWKGLNVARTYVIPANPNTTPQQTQRNLIKAAVTLIKAGMAHPVFPFNEVDKSAYSLWASTFATPRTWFNAAVKNYVDQEVDSLDGEFYGGGSVNEVADECDVITYDYTGDVTAGVFKYGTSKTSMINSKAATVAGQQLRADITSLTSGTKYYFQFEATAPAGKVGTKSGIYHGTPL